jgi:hypothetical protein
VRRNQTLVKSLDALVTDVSIDDERSDTQDTLTQLRARAVPRAAIADAPAITAAQKLNRAERQVRRLSALSAQRTVNGVPPLATFRVEFDALVAALDLSAARVSELASYPLGAKWSLLRAWRPAVALLNADDAVEDDGAQASAATSQTQAFRPGVVNLLGMIDVLYRCALLLLLLLIYTCVCCRCWCIADQNNATSSCEYWQCSTGDCVCAISRV